ncbi:MAG: CRISPR-associated endonuclease Cas3'', partial [Thermoleophilia bacterium]
MAIQGVRIIKCLRQNLASVPFEALIKIPIIKNAYAHSANSEGVKHHLIDHLENVTALAVRYANGFGAAELAQAVGLLHDIGKAHPRFQAYLEGHGPSIDHKSTGAVVAGNCLEPLALIVAGHHGGLRETAELKASWLPESQRVIESDESLKSIREAFSFLADQPLPFPPYLRSQL